MDVVFIEQINKGKGHKKSRHRMVRKRRMDSNKADANAEEAQVQKTSHQSEISGMPDTCPAISTGRSVVEILDPQERAASAIFRRRRDGYNYEIQATRERPHPHDHQPHICRKQSQGYSIDTPHNTPLIPATGSSGIYSYPPPPPHSHYHNPSFSYGQIVMPSLVPPTAGGSVPVFSYPYQPPAYAGYPHYHWAPVEYISEIKPSDVLCGRGGATNSHSGNRAFRSLVKRYQDQYLKAKKRDKPAVAAIVVQRIRDKGGRFVKRIDTPTPEGRVLWVDIGDDRAKEKTCQALREGAPEIRRKRKTSSTDEEDVIKKANAGKGELSPNSNSSLSRSHSDDEGGGSFANRTMVTRNTGRANACQHPSQPQSAPIMIRPSAALIRRPFLEFIPIDQLDPHERELYLRDFLPPDPGIRKHTSYTSSPPTSFVEVSSARHENSSTWPSIQV